METQTDQKYVCDGLAVEFKHEPMEDRDETQRAGHIVYRDQPFVTIYLPGGMDKRVHIADDNFFRKRDPSYKAAFDAWSANEDIELDGTDIKMATFLTPAQIATCRAANILTIEQLADAGDSVIERIGMGFGGLRKKAQIFLKAASGAGVATEQLSAANVEIDQLKSENAGLRQTIAELEGRLKGMEAQMGGVLNAKTPTPPQRPAKPAPAPKVEVETPPEAESAVERAIAANKAKAPKSAK